VIATLDRMYLGLTPSAAGLYRSSPMTIRTTPPTVTAKRQTRFFFSLALVMLAIVAAGFGPTLYLRPWFAAPNGRVLHPEQLVHGIVLTGWFTLFVAQSFLVNSGRTRTHMRVGIAGGVLAIAVVVSSLVTMREATQRFAAAGIDLRTRVIPIIVSDFWVLVVFTLLVAAAVQFRRQVATHKRLMLLASVMLIGPALSTVRPIGRLLVPYLPFLLLRPSVVFIAICIIALGCFDLATKRRLEPATLWGSGALIAAVVITTIMAFGESGAILTRWLTGVTG
jgi:uncharacterized membrane protein YozB (DUF420 family)